MSKKTIINLCQFVAVFLIAGSIGTCIRLFPLRHYASDTSWDKASLVVVNNAVNNIRENINRSSAVPLPAEAQTQLATAKLNEIMANDKKAVKSTILKVAKTLDRETPPRHTFPYLLASDSYYHYHLTKKILKSGRLGSRTKGSKFFYPEMTAPTGYWEPLTLHPYMGAFVYKTISVFAPNIPLMFAVSFTPLIMALLALLAFLILGRTMKCSGWSMVTAGIYFLCARIFLKRSAFGWYDNDPYNVLFPVTLMMLLALAFSAAQKRKKIIYGLVCAAALSLYAFFWQGWMFIATVLGVSGVFLIILERLTNRSPEADRAELFWSVFGAGSVIGIGLILGWGEIIVLFQEGWQALQGFFNTYLSVWPDTYIAVGELKKMNFSSLITLTGGWTMLSLAFVGVASRTFKILSDKDITRHRLFITTVIFAAAAFIMSLGAQRFTLLCVTPFAILFLFGLNDALAFALKLAARIPWAVRPFMQRALLPAIMCLALIIPKVIHTESTMAQLLDPIFNSTWEDSLVWIRENTPPDSIINSWWPPGHFIKCFAERRVLFDGATINNPKGYWLANAFLASTESEAAAFLRLANNDSAQAVAILKNAGMNDSRAVSFLKELIRFSRKTAQLVAEQNLPKDIARELIAITHADPGPVYLLVYNEMQENLLLYPFVARWDFEKIEGINARPELRRQIPPAGSTAYIEFLWRISGGRPRISDIFKPLRSQGDTLYFPHDLTIDMRAKTCRISSPTYGMGIPKFLFYEENGEVISKPLPNASLPYAVVLGSRHGQYQARLLDVNLAQSFLTRIYFFGDTGLTHVKRIRQDKNLTGRMQIDVFEIKP